MTDDIERLRLDTVHEDHPLRLLCAETRRLEAELEQMRDLAKQNGRERDDALRRLRLQDEECKHMRRERDALREERDRMQMQRDAVLKLLRKLLAAPDDDDVVERRDASIDDEFARLREERDALAALLAEARCALSEVRAHMHAQGRRPEECYEMSVIDAALRGE